MKTVLMSLAFGLSFQAQAAPVPAEIQEAIQEALAQRCVAFASTQIVSTVVGAYKTSDQETVTTYKTVVAVSYRHDQNSFESKQITVHAFLMPSVVGVEAIQAPGLCK